MARFVANPGFERELAREAPMQNVIEDATKDILATAQSLEPSDHFTRGGFADLSLDTDGWTGHAGTTNPFAHLIEWGSINNPAYAPLRRAVIQSGLRFTEQGR